MKLKRETKALLVAVSISLHIHAQEEWQHYLFAVCTLIAVYLIVPGDDA